MRQAATTADIMGRTLSRVCVGSAGEEDDAPADDDDDAPAVGGGEGGGGSLRVKWRNLHMSRKRSLVIRSAMGR